MHIDKGTIIGIYHLLNELWQRKCCYFSVTVATDSYCTCQLGLWVQEGAHVMNTTGEPHTHLQCSEYMYNILACLSCIPPSRPHPDFRAKDVQERRAVSQHNDCILHTSTASREAGWDCDAARYMQFTLHWFFLRMCLC